MTLISRTSLFLLNTFYIDAPMDYMPIQYIRTTRRGITLITIGHTNIKPWLSRDEKSDDTIRWQDKNKDRIEHISDDAKVMYNTDEWNE